MQMMWDGFIYLAATGAWLMALLLIGHGVGVFNLFNNKDRW